MEKTISYIIDDEQEQIYRLRLVDQKLGDNTVSLPLWLTEKAEFDLFGATIQSGGSKLIASQTALQWGGPETRTRCIGYMKTKGLPTCHFEGIKLYCEDTWIETCTEWATDFKQHSYDINMYGPSDMDPNQLTEIKDACTLAAITTQFLQMPLAIDTIVSLFTDTRPVMEATLRACLATTGVLGGLVVEGFHLELQKRDFW